MLFVVPAEHLIGAVATGLTRDRWHYVAGSYDVRPCASRSTIPRRRRRRRRAASAIRHPPSAIRHPPSAIRHPPSAIRHPTSAFAAIGSNLGDSSRFLRDVRVYARALDAAGIAALVADDPVARRRSRPGSGDRREPLPDARGVTSASQLG